MPIAAVFQKTTIVTDMQTAMMAAMRPTAQRLHVLENSYALMAVLVENQNVLLNRNYVIRKKTVKITLMKNLHAVSFINTTEVFILKWTYSTQTSYKGLSRAKGVSQWFNRIFKDI